MTTRTGGGRGASQHAVRGVSKSQSSSEGDRDVKQAVREPAWDDLSAKYAHVTPKGTERALARFLAQQCSAIHGDAVLEGFSYTLSEIVDLLSGAHVPGHTEGEEMQVIDMKKAADSLAWRVKEGLLNPSQELSDDLHGLISAHLTMPTHWFRGDQRRAYNGPRVALGRGRYFHALDARLTHDALNVGLERILQIEHPLVRGATWAAFAAYQQFYFDGNKRTGRYTMNAVAMSHGYDAILVPAREKLAYEHHVVDALESDSLTDHIRFLLSFYSAE